MSQTFDRDRGKNRRTGHKRPHPSRFGETVGTQEVCQVRRNRKDKLKCHLLMQGCYELDFCLPFLDAWSLLSKPDYFLYHNFLFPQKYTPTEMRD